MKKFFQLIVEMFLARLIIQFWGKIIFRSKSIALVLKKLIVEIFLTRLIIRFWEKKNFRNKSIALVKLLSRWKVFVKYLLVWLIIRFWGKIIFRSKSITRLSLNYYRDEKFSWSLKCFSINNSILRKDNFS